MTKPWVIDLNADLGESLLTGNENPDQQIMPYITSANIACGYHAGDQVSMEVAVEAAIKNRVAIGAHPGFPDKEGFGRREMQIPDLELLEMIQDQINLLNQIVSRQGGTLIHVKPHGALYNMAAKDVALSGLIAKAIVNVNPKLVLVGLAGSVMIAEAEKLGLTTAHEAFADRRYKSDGQLVPRSVKGSVIHEIEEACFQVGQIVMQQELTSLDGQLVPILAQTICLHGDHPGSVQFAQSLHAFLMKNGISVQSIQDQLNV